MNEQCWFIHGIRIGNRFAGLLKYHSEGSPAHVSFDGSKAQGKVLGFYHSHPSGISSPSSRDDRTMKAWVICEGRPMICGIFCDGHQRSFLYFRNNRKEIVYKEVKSKVAGNIFLGSV